jgi:hypothetical protein
VSEGLDSDTVSDGAAVPGPRLPDRIIYRAQADSERRTDFNLDPAVDRFVLDAKV